MYKFFFVKQSQRPVSKTLSSIARLLAICTVMALGACGGDSSSHRDDDSGNNGPHTVTYSVAGSVSGLIAGGLVLQNNNGDNLTVAANASSFQFTTPVAAGGAYNVTVTAQPANLNCTVSRGAGTNVQAPVSDISIVCSARTHTIAGTIAGLNVNGLILQNNGVDDVTIAANATTFQFATPIAAGGGYQVTVSAQPAGQTCTVSNGSANNVVTDILSIHITCSATVLSIGGTITGLTGSGLILQNNGGDNLSVAVNAGTFNFDTLVAYGGGYAATIFAQPAGQTCSIADGSGIAITNIANVAVTCANIPTYTLTVSSGANGSVTPSGSIVLNSGGNQGFIATSDVGYAVEQWVVDGALAQTGGGVYTLANVTANHTVAVTFGQAALSTSVSAMALAVNCQPASSCMEMQNAQLTGTPRSITIVNTGSIAATNVSIDYPTWPTGTSASSTCGVYLAPAAACTITITPGSSSTGSCTTGIAPTPDVVTVSSDVTAAVTVNVTVLNYGCIYQQGFIYSIDDTTSTSGSIGGKTAALTDTFPGQTSITTGVPDWGGLGTDIGTNLNQNNAQGANDGAANSAAIVSALTSNYSAPPYNGSSPLSLTDYAAGLCSTVAVDATGSSPCTSGTCYTNWYLPATCELAPAGGGVACPAGSTNIQTQLFDNLSIPVLGLVDHGDYWSSTQLSIDPSGSAWIQQFVRSGGRSNDVGSKDLTAGVRCSRALAP